GIACIALTGWRQSTRKSSKVEEELSELVQNLKKREAELEALKWSESQLQAKGLSAFLDEEATQKPVLEAPANSFKTETEPVVEPLVITSQPLEAQPVVPSSATVQASAAKFASTQTFLGYAQAHATAKPSPQVMTPTPQEVEQLHTQLQQIMSQMAALQTALSTSQGAVKSEEQVPVGSAPLHVVKTGSVDRTA
ncbi:MAG: hypothetical protein LDL41_18985, partial [Coleofasciculus sp. S288]|nr:hypothetical protein [Coleofasciculus sp. S288]